MLDKLHTLYFLGIGGIGMSALARFFLLHGKQVFGYDLTPTDITAQLMAEGAQIHFDEDVSKIPENVDVVVYTPAVPKEHKEYQYFVSNKMPIVKRSEILGMICKEYPTIAVAGTHGKTTTTAMIAQVMRGARCEVRGERCKVDGGLLAFIGGIAKNFGGNFVCDDNFDTVVVEADEFDRSFLTLHPQVAIITSIDADHLDIYGSHKHLKESFQLFANQMEPNGKLVIYDEIAHQIEHPNKITYGFSDTAHYQISNIQYHPTKTTLTTNHLSLTTNIPGRHNALNAVAAFAATVEFLSLKNDATFNAQTLEPLVENLAGFTGVKRRFDIRIQRDDFVFIDDYAHHPAEIKAFLDAVKKSYPTKKLTGVFQPHLYSRTRDFAQEFADRLEVLDEIILLDIYPAREQPIEGISSNYLRSLIKNENKKLLKKEELLPYLQKTKPEVLLTMGAGDIDKIVEFISISPPIFSK